MSTPQVGSPAPTTAQRPLPAGARDALPMVMTLVPFALAVGAAMAFQGVPAFTGWSTSWLIVGGAAQLVAVQALDGGAHAALVVALALVVNATATCCTARRWLRTRGTGRAAGRLLGAYFLADPVYALAIGRFERVRTSARPTGCGTTQASPPSCGPGGSCSPARAYSSPPACPAGCR